MARRTFALALALAAFVPATAGRAADSDVTVDPAVGTPDTAFHVEVPALFKIDKPVRGGAAPLDRYAFVVRGPGGKQCETTVTDRVRITPTRRAKHVFVDLPGVRVVSSKEIVPGPWCVGTFTGRVEFQDWRPRSHRYVIHRIGNFSWQVQDGS